MNGWRAGISERRLGSIVDVRRSARSASLRQRLRALVGALDERQVPPESGRELIPLVVRLLSAPDQSTVWLTLAVLRAELPLEADVIAAAREIALDGPLDVLRRILLPSANPLHRGRELRTVTVMSGTVLVDVEHTSHTALATGIQRVARQTTSRWSRDHEITLVGWTQDHRAMRLLDESERAVALRGGDETTVHHVGGDGTIVVPWGATYILPELATEMRRTNRLLALARFSRSRTSVIGFDCVPLSSGETIGAEMGTAFANNLAAVRHMDRVAAISHAAAREYEGWREMLVGVGLPGPGIATIMLPVEAEKPTPHAVEMVRSTLTTDALPLILCVGSHEPRKNHLAVLQGAELAWRAGTRFSLVFVGGNSWGGEGFRERMSELQEAGRPVQSVSALSDDLLWAAYDVARCVVFPSLNEGYGLPVAEAIASGTPVITSSFGSMQEIGQAGGALLVDPRDDHAIAQAITTLVDDEQAHARLVTEARDVPGRTWDQYATEAWEYVVGG
ncbi:glycosyltransferase [Pengzhenrongella sicca]|uniref:Glycosyltransferase n=1 Tax=Pengzhenrongella sicca TaxID=2819238 RepID=A0A8A4ZKY2_9MICO|nr:glycosyltransferase [Pengzhenrongella sicca]QTE30238.1 glycosyltransferase [Pengzhenrongella sicca]